MKSDKVILVAGGDLRQTYIAEQFTKLSSMVYAVGFDEEITLDGNIHTSKNYKEIAKLADIIILPMPVSNDGERLNAPFAESDIYLNRLFSNIKKDAVVLGGKFTKDVLNLAEEYGVTTFDYLDREELAVQNAVPTAEGAIEIAMGELPTTIYKSRCLITGYGRIAKVLAKSLIGLGAKVTIAARKYSDIAWAEINGCRAINISDLSVGLLDYDIIFNTVPALIFDYDRLKRVRKHTLLIDLASKPGGVDFLAAKNLGVKTVWALSLPGKVAPITSGIIIKDTILNILEERGIVI